MLTQLMSKQEPESGLKGKWVLLYEVTSQKRLGCTTLILQCISSLELHKPRLTQKICSTVSQEFTRGCAISLQTLLRMPKVQWTDNKTKQFHSVAIERHISPCLVRPFYSGDLMITQLNLKVCTDWLPPVQK